MEKTVTVPYNDLDLERWKEYPDILTDSLWLFPHRDRTGGHSLTYHGNFVPQVARQLILRYSKQGEVVLDLFFGSGTTGIECVLQGRQCIGVEIDPAAVSKYREEHGGPAFSWPIIQADSTSAKVQHRVREALHCLRPDNLREVHLVILHPPYWSIIQFSEDPHDLSRAPSMDAFLAGFRRAACNAYDLLAPDRFCGLVIGDLYRNGEYIPLGFHCVQILQEIGWKLRSINVKDIHGNERGKGKRSGLWRYRALRSGIQVFAHEYVMVFQKPA